MRLVQVTPIYVPPVMPAARVRLGVNQGVLTGVWTKISFDTVDYDTTADFDAVNYRYICSEAGLYLVCANGYIISLADGNYFRMIVRVNNINRGNHVLYRIGGAGSTAVAGSDILSLSVNDYIELRVYHDFGATRNLLGGDFYTNYMAIHKLS